MPAQWDPITDRYFRSARSIAEGLQHTWIGTEHIGLAMLAAPGSLLVGKLRALGRHPEEVEKRIKSALDGTDGLAPLAEGGIALSPRMRHMVAMAESQAASDGCLAIEERHLLQALIEGGPGDFIRALLALGIEPGSLWRARQQALQVLTETAADGPQASPPRRDTLTPSTVPVRR
ncbi:MAG TPA: Clp protease N-terminal domain-containing protein, partial [Candidatus Xenobia bacterium]